MKASFRVNGYISGVDSDGWNDMQEDVVILEDGSVGLSDEADENTVSLEYGEDEEITSLGSITTAFVEAAKKGNIKLAIAANVYGGCGLQYLISEELEEELLDLIPRDRRSPIYGGVVSWDERLTKKYWADRKNAAQAADWASALRQIADDMEQVK